MIDYLRSIEPTMALPVRRVATPDELVWKPVEEALKEPYDTFLITPARFVSDMKIHRNEDGYSADVVATPALYYSRGNLVTPQRLMTTSFSADWSHLADDGKTVVDKRADFVRWGKNVMQWVRRVAPGWYRYKSHRITPKADARRQAGMEMVW